MENTRWIAYPSYSGLKKEKTLREVLDSIAGKNSWGDDDTKVLVASTVDDYYNLFKQEHGGHLSSWINTCLRFGNFSNATEDDKKIANSTEEALTRIDKENRLNAKRVAKFGIKV